MPDVESVAIDAPCRDRLRRRLETLYGPRGDVGELLVRLEEVLVGSSAQLAKSAPRQWDQSDVVLITYGDQLRREGASPLSALADFLTDQRWADLVSTVHILPFYPYSSDDGFSVIDYLQVDPTVGDWQDVERIGRDFRLMFDLVLNHCSAQSAWFAAYQRGESPFNRFFIEVDPATDLSAVVRPRSLPLITEVETSRGSRGVWTTFSADQVDLNFAEPEVLFAMLEVLLAYASRGAQIIRLDAVAFLWKEIGTPCIHLPQTHEAVKLMRDVLTIVAPDVWLLTETNVPHEENISYFGNGDEAQMVYQFALPPLLLDAFSSGDASYFMKWLDELQSPPPGVTYFNFTASHDGVGVRPLEGLLPAERIDALINAVRQRGGLVSTRRQGDRDLPYELNIAYVDALQPENAGDVRGHARRFLGSQAVMLALQGVPAAYIHSVVGTRNDTEGAERADQPRRINRRKFSWHELRQQIGEVDALSAMIYAGYRRLLEVRRAQSAFHPSASQQVLTTESSQLICFLRRSVDQQQTVLVAVNVSDRDVELDPRAFGVDLRYDLISDQEVENARPFELLPGQAVWLTA